MVSTVNSIDGLQPLDLAIQKPLKDKIKKQFKYRYAEELKKKLTATQGTENSNSKVIELKPLGL